MSVPPPVRVLAVSSDDPYCGISNYTSALRHHLVAGTQPISMTRSADLLDPAVEHGIPDVYWLNYHAALHSRWTAEEIRKVVAQTPVVVTYHDTSVPNSDQARSVCRAASVVIVHEPCDDLDVPPNRLTYLHQPVPTPVPPVQLHDNGRPRLGTIGHPFPWKNYPLLAEATKHAGWDLHIIGLAAPTDMPELRQPHVYHHIDVASASVALGMLRSCDATAFIYTCANTGTSGAIRQGIGARKPVIATHPSICRQFRDLLGEPAITWMSQVGLDDMIAGLASLSITDRPDPVMCELAERQSWTHAAARYAAIFELAYLRSR